MNPSLRSRLRWIVVAVVALVGLFVWWLERDRARHFERDHGGPSHVAAARMTLREIQVAQELHAADNDGRYAASLDPLRALDSELGPLLAGGVTATVEGGGDGAWYAAEAGHRELPGWRCRVASDSAPAVLAGDLAAGEQSCDPPPQSTDAD